MSEFKVGHEVRLISDNPKFGKGEVEVGDIGIIERDQIDYLVIRFPKQDFWHGLSSELELVGDVVTQSALPMAKEGSVIVKLDQLIEAQKVEIADAKATYRAAQRKLSQMQAAKTLVEGL